MLVLRRHYKRKLIPIQAIVVIGLYMLCCGRGGLGDGFGAGEGFALLAAVLLAGSLVCGEQSLEKVDPITLSALQTAASAIMAAIGMLASNETQTSATTPVVWAIILYLAILCTIAGYVLQNIALKSIRAHTVAVVQCLTPVMTAVFSYFILGEHMSTFGLIGAGMILCCLILAVKLDD